MDPSHQSRLAASNGCQSLQGLFRCKLLKTRNRGTQQVSGIRRSDQVRRPTRPDGGRERVHGVGEAEGSLCVAHFALRPYPTRHFAHRRIHATHSKFSISVFLCMQTPKDAPRQLRVRWSDCALAMYSSVSTSISQGSYSTMLPSRIRCKSFKTNDRRARYSTINRGVQHNTLDKGREVFCCGWQSRRAQSRSRERARPECETRSST